MNVFFYDRTWAGLLSVVFDAYSRGVFPGMLLKEGGLAPLQALSAHTVETAAWKAGRVRAGLKKRLSPQGRQNLFQAWLSEQEGSDMLLLRVMRKIFDTPRPVERDYADGDMLAVHRLARKVSCEAHRLEGFARFQMTGQGVWFSAFAPRHNVLPLLLDHFGDRFADQPWILYDARRRYGVLRAEGRFREIALEISLDEGGGLADGLLAERETLFQELWKSYCRAITIKERLNPRQQLRCMPRRFRPYLTELREARPTSFPRLSA